MDITEQIAEIRAKLEKLERQTQEEPKPLLAGPCIAKTRGGVVVSVHRGCRIGYCFQYLIGDFFQTISEDGKYRSDKTAHASDIVEVVRLLTEQEVLDWQFRGIEPELSVASEPVAVVAEVFKSSELGKKEAEQMGLVHLGKATSEGMHEVNGTLYYFDYWNDEWKPNPGDYWVCKAHIYAYKPSGE